MPALLEAQQGLDTLKATDITEMRSFANPVDTLRLIGYCMLIYLGQPSITWKDVYSFFFFILHFLRLINPIGIRMTKFTTDLINQY
jgi:hypothetical protein